MAIKCTRCKASNPDNKRFCGECGGPLDPAFGAMKELISVTLRDQIRDVLRENYKEQKIVEVETSQAIATRLAEWAKLLGFFLGIPIALLFLLLGAVGVRTYSDLSTRIQSAESAITDRLNNVTTRLNDAQRLAAKLQSDGDALTSEYEKLTAGLQNTKTLAMRVDTLSAEYQKLADGLAKTHALADRVDTLGQQITNIKDSLRSALVIGNGAYPNFSRAAQLTRPMNDARAVSDALTNIGFKVTSGENLSRIDTFERLHGFADRLVPGDTAFVYYSGHGISFRGENYLLPSDFPAELTADRWDQMRPMAIGVTDVVAVLKATKASVIVLVVDACRNDLYLNGTRSIAVGEIEPAAADAQGFFTLYSANTGQFALDSLSADDRDPNSLFTRVLVAELKKPNLSLVEVAQRVQQQVSRLASTVGQKQIPAFYNETLGPVYLAGRVQ